MDESARAPRGARRRAGKARRRAHSGAIRHSGSKLHILQRFMALTVTIIPSLYPYFYTGFRSTLADLGGLRRCRRRNKLARRAPHRTEELAPPGRRPSVANSQEGPVRELAEAGQTTACSEAHQAEGGTAIEPCSNSPSFSCQNSSPSSASDSHT